MDRCVRVFVVEAEIIIMRGSDRSVTAHNLSLTLLHRQSGDSMRKNTADS
jgi:hypothetical protein